MGGKFIGINDLLGRDVNVIKSSGTTFSKVGGIVVEIITDRIVAIKEKKYESKRQLRGNHMFSDYLMKDNMIDVVWVDIMAENVLMIEVGHVLRGELRDQRLSTFVKEQ